MIFFVSFTFAPCYYLYLQIYGFKIHKLSVVVKEEFSYPGNIIVLKFADCFEKKDYPYGKRTTEIE